ncbi:MAG: pentapeptide repeat-containing protein [Calothrix sp. MO_167.B12]|nr:pentapeptide repeat-containing protein [Calothrix sp. MO_167.B12]
MSANLTDACLKWLMLTAVVFNFSSTVYLLSFSRMAELPTKEKIEHKNQLLSTTATLFLGLAFIIHTYYAAKRVKVMQDSANTASKNMNIGIRSTRLTQERLIAERLNNAIAQLGADNISTRTGAIYILERVAQDSQAESWTVMEILTAFIRERSTIHPHKYLYTEELVKLPTDIQTALTVIGRRNVELDSPKEKLDLRDIDIRKADLRQGNFQRVDLRSSNLSGADMAGSVLVEADMEDSIFSGANLEGANLQSANFHRANLSTANLHRAVVKEANLRSANLSGASLCGANFTGANLYKANLQQANLKFANLSGAKLFLVNLQSANLSKATLKATGLIGANLKQAKLNGANLQQANLNAAKLEEAEIFFANLHGASFAEANLCGANLMGSNLQQVNFHEANLCDANLMGTNLLGTELSVIQKQNASLAGVKNLKIQQFKDCTIRLSGNVEFSRNWRRYG